MWDIVSHIEAWMKEKGTAIEEAYALKGESILCWARWLGLQTISLIWFLKAGGKAGLRLSLPSFFKSKRILRVPPFLAKTMFMRELCEETISSSKSLLSLPWSSLNVRVRGTKTGSL